MKKILAALFAAFLMMGIVSGASALTIYPDNKVLEGNETSNEAILVAVNNYLTGLYGSATWVDLYKRNVDDNFDTGSYASSYETEFFNEPDDPAEATITYINGPYITGYTPYLIVKDGNQIPAWYLFNLSSWNGMETINLESFWPDQGAISHIQILGKTTSVPEPMTLILLGLGMVGLAGVRRFKK